MVIFSAGKTLKRIDDLRAAAAAARALAKHFNGQESRSILELADDLDLRALEEESRLAQFSAEAERRSDATS